VNPGDVRWGLLFRDALHRHGDAGHDGAWCSRASS
jgi:hypothetical protein